MTDITPRPPQIVARTYNWDAAAEAWIRERVAEGHSVAAIAEEAGITIYAVHCGLKRFGLVARGRPREVDLPGEVTPFALAIREARYDDMPPDVLCRELGPVRRTKSHPIGPLTKLTPRRPVGRALDFDTIGGPSYHYGG